MTYSQASDIIAHSPGSNADPAPKRRQRRLGPGPVIPFGLQIGPVLLIVIWSLGSGLGLIDPRTLPAPWTVASSFVTLWENGRLQANFSASATRALLGLVLGVGIGLVLAVISGLSRFGEAVIDGPVQIWRAVPTLAVIPVFILWFGIGEFMKVTVITMTVLIPIYIHTHNALRSIDSRFVELAETLRMSRKDFILQVVLPGALPGFFLGLRFGVTLCWLSLVVVEQINAINGLGYMMDLARSYGQLDIVFVGLFVYAVLGVGSDWLVRFIEKKVLSWRKTLAH